MWLRIDEEIPIDRWNNFLSESTFNSVFQTPDFYYLFNSIPGFSAKAFTVEDISGIRVLCVVTIQKGKGIKGFFSRRAIIYGGPIFIKENYEAFEFLLKNINHQLRGKVIYIEVRNSFDYSKLMPFYTKVGWNYLPYLNVKLKLKGESLKDVLSAMHYNRRRQIQLSLMENAIYRQVNDISEVKELYLILKELYYNRVKLPLPNLNFFIELFKSPIARIFIVIHGNKIIGGSFCLLSEMKTIHTLYYCGYRDYNKKIFPTHLAVLAAIDYGVENELEYLDFMGAGLKGNEYGVRKYKLEFGGLLVEDGRFLKILQPIFYSIGKFGLKIYKTIYS